MMEKESERERSRWGVEREELEGVIGMVKARLSQAEGRMKEALEGANER